MIFLFSFFFSSRRRHTRSLRDWSSDVCSSDLFGDRPANLIPLAMFMFSPLAFSTSLWWASSLGLAFQNFFIAALLLTVLLYIRAPSSKQLAVVGVTYVAALLFWQKALLILPVIVAFAVLFLGEGSGGQRLRNVLLGRRKLWILLTATTLPYIVWYLSIVDWPLAVHPTGAQLVRLTRMSLGTTLIPTFLGGPWAASQFGFGIIPELPG